MAGEDIPQFHHHRAKVEGAPYQRMEGFTIMISSGPVRVERRETEIGSMSWSKIAEVQANPARDWNRACRFSRGEKRWVLEVDGLEIESFDRVTS